MGYAEWPPKRNYPDPNPALRERIQKALIDVAGFAPGGFPMLHLAWGQEEKEFFDGKMVMKYCYSEQDLDRGWIAKFPTGDKWYPPSANPPDVPKGIVVYRSEETIEIGIPRWFVEQWYPWNQHDAETWEDTRYAYEDGLKIDVNGEMPPYGIYKKAFHLIAYKNNGCCAKAKAKRMKCYHNYRDPAQADVSYCAGLWKQNLEAATKHRIDERVPQDVKDKLTKERLEELQADALKNRKLMRQRVKEVLNFSRRRLFDQGSGRDIIHDFGAARQKAAQN